MSATGATPSGRSLRVVRGVPDDLEVAALVAGLAAAAAASQVADDEAPARVDQPLAQPARDRVRGDRQELRRPLGSAQRRRLAVEPAVMSQTTTVLVELATDPWRSSGRSHRTSRCPRCPLARAGAGGPGPSRPSRPSC
ncbi:acyl-CoA carboxylase epsilon subunit [Oerskovia sp. M15]